MFSREVTTIFFTRHVRLAFLVFIAEAVLLVVISNLPVLPGELQDYAFTFLNTGSNLRGAAFPQLMLWIFFNNLQVSWLQVTPVLGQAYFLSALYRTARVIQVGAVYNHVSSLTYVLSIYSVPHGWIETYAYATATVEGLFGLLPILRKRWRSFPTVTVLTWPYMGLTLLSFVVLLFVAAVFEAAEFYIEAPFVYLTWIPFLLLLSAAVLVIRQRVFRASTIPTQTQENAPHV